MIKDVALYTIRSITIFLVILIAGAIGHLFILEPSEVNGRSMEPTFQDQDLIIIDKLSLLTHPPQRGDLVSAFNEDGDLLIVKRIIGEPGEQVVLRQGDVFIRSADGNEFALDEIYLEKGQDTFPRVGTRAVYPVLGENEYFLLGDNRDVSIDSRSYGSVHRSNIIGKIRKVPF